MTVRLSELKAFVTNPTPKQNDPMRPITKALISESDGYIIVDKAKYARIVTTAMIRFPILQRTRIHLIKEARSTK